MKTGQRGTYIWLAILGVAVGAIMLAGAAGGAVAGEVAFGILAAYLALVFVALAGTRLRSIQLPKAPRITIHITPAARRAAQRARTRPEYSADNILTDVGLILNQRRSDGRWDRQLAQAVSLDDDALQPFIALDVPPQSADRLALVKFEITDQSGRVQFTRQIEQWLRDGVNNVICDRQMPLRNNQSVGRSGVWDLRVSVDGALAGLHSFSVAPSTDERRRRLSSDGEVVPDHVDAADEDLPMSLQDMLREQHSNDKG